MAIWKFKSTGAWHWQRLDEVTEEVLAEAHVGFFTLRDCVNDAHRNGYTVPYESVSDAILTDVTIGPHRLRPPPSTRY